MPQASSPPQLSTANSLASASSPFPTQPPTPTPAPKLRTLTFFKTVFPDGFRLESQQRIHPPTNKTSHTLHRFFTPASKPSLLTLPTSSLPPPNPPTKATNSPSTPHQNPRLPLLDQPSPNHNTNNNHSLSPKSRPTLFSTKPRRPDHLLLLLVNSFPPVRPNSPTNLTKPRPTPYNNVSLTSKSKPSSLTSLKQAFNLNNSRLF